MGDGHGVARLIVVSWNVQGRVRSVPEQAAALLEDPADVVALQEVRLSAMGLPTPNIFAGGHDFHSPREWVTVQDMAAASAVIVRLAEQWASGA